MTGIKRLSYNLRHCTTVSKMAACWWGAAHLPVSPLKTKWQDHWLCKICHHLRNCERAVDKKCFGIFHFDKYLTLKDYVHEIHSNAANNEADTTPFGSFEDPAKLLKQQHCPEHIFWFL